MNDGYGDYHTDQQTTAPYEIHLESAIVREILSDLKHYHKKAVDCRKRGDEHKAQEWDEKAAAAARELETYLPPRGGG